MPDYTERLCSLFEARLPLAIESDGHEDDWNVIGPAMLAGAVRHLRAIEQLQTSLPSAVIAWQLVRSMFEYVATYSWIAADPATRTEQWLKSDYVQRLKLDNDFRELGDELLAKDERQRVVDFRPEAPEMPGSLVDRAKQADDAWADRVREFAASLPEENRSFRALYPLIYRNGSRFTHPSSDAVNAFVGGAVPRLAVAEERPLERDLALIGSGILALGLAVAASATPALRLKLDEIQAALTGVNAASRTRKLHKRLHTHRTFDEEQVDLNEKA